MIASCTNRLDKTGDFRDSLDSCCEQFSWASPGFTLDDCCGLARICFGIRLTRVCGTSQMTYAYQPFQSLYSVQRCVFKDRIANSFKFQAHACSESERLHAAPLEITFRSINRSTNCALRRTSRTRLASSACLDRYA